MWLRRRIHRGGRAWLLLQVRREWLLFDGEVAAQVIGTVNREGLIEAASHYWPNGLNSSELETVLT